MNFKKICISAFVGFGLIKCGPAASESGSELAAAVSTADAESVCYSAGISHLPRAGRYEAYFGKSGDGPTYTSASGIFTFEAPFANGTSKIVDARAAYHDDLIAEEGKILNIRYTGGIANVRHSTENFRLMFGFKIGGQDEWVEMNWHSSPTTTYTAYSLDFLVPAVGPDSLQVWFEGRYTENGEEKRVYDSNSGQNFTISIVEDTGKSLCFDSGWREALQGGELTAGDSVEIVYDVERLIDRMMGTSYAGWPAWSAYMHYQITDADGSVTTRGKLPLFASAYDPANGGPSTRKPSYKPLLKIPASAKGGQLIMWFEGPNRGPTVWDSNYQQNYVTRIR